jgi:hypothetical protein
MSLLDKIIAWTNKKTYFSFRDAESLEEKDCRLLSNLDLLNISIVFCIISFSLGIFISTIFFRRYIDPSYQEERNKIMIMELYKDFEKVKKHNQQRNDFILSLQNFMNDKNDFVAETNIKNYKVKHFCLPVRGAEIISTFVDENFKAKVKKNDVIFAVDDGTIILNSQNKDTTALIIQHENGFISVYNFSGGSDKKVNEKVSIGEKIGVIDKNSEICLQVFSEGQKIMANNLFIN